jgi:hypothetical protein
MLVPALYLFPDAALAAVAFDDGASSGGGEQSISFSISNASDMIIATLGNNGSFSSTCAMNGTSMTALHSASNENTFYFSVFGILATSTGNVTVECTDGYFTLGAVAYSGTNLVLPTVFDDYSSTSSTNFALTLTPVANNALLVAQIADYADSSAGANTEITTAYQPYMAWADSITGQPAGVPATLDYDLGGNVGAGFVSELDPSTQPAATSTVTVFLTSGTSWTVPSNWNSSNNTIEVIGGGAGGGQGFAGGSGNGGGGGGSGAYSEIANLSLTPGGSVTYQVGTGGTGGVGGGANPAAGGDTYFNGTSCPGASACAKGGSAPTGTQLVTGGVGGVAANGVGTTKNSGGNGGTSLANKPGTGGGGGAGGRNGNGAAGGSAATLSGAFGGSGGGGSGGGTAGSSNLTDGSGTGGSGGNNSSGSGGGAGGAASATGGGGSAGGGGGGGAAGANGGFGGAGIEWDSSHGSGGGGGGGGSEACGCTAGAGGIGGLYGGGGGGGSEDSNAANGGAGAQGIIVITYTPLVGRIIRLSGHIILVGGVRLE